MKFLLSILFISCIYFSSFSQGTVIGNVYFQSSGKKAAIGVPVNAKGSNGDFSKSNGAFTLVFPNFKKGKTIQAFLGDQQGGKITDAQGKELEWVNNTDLNYFTIPEKAKDNPLLIIVCPKGARDVAARRYYKILKSSSELELAQSKKEIDQLLSQKEKDHKKLAELFDLVANLEEQVDSIRLYKEAFSIASINKDDASERVLKYLELLDEGKSIRTARAVLSKTKADEEIGNNIKSFKSGIEELVIRANASLALFDYKDALACYQIIIRRSEEINIDRKILADYYNETSIILVELGNYKEALKFQEKATAIAQVIFPEADLELASHFGHHAAVLGYAKQDPEKALEFVLKSLQIRKQLLEPDDSEIAKSYNNIAICYNKLNDPQKALEYLHLSEEIELKKIEEEEPGIGYAILLNNIASVYVNIGQKEKAVIYVEKAIRINEQIIDPNSPDYSKHCSTIAAVYDDLNQYDKAVIYYEKSMENYEKLFNPLNPRLAALYNNYASSLTWSGQAEKAIEFQLKAIYILENNLERNDPNLGSSYNNIGFSYAQLKEYKKAIYYQEKSIQIKEKLYAPNDKRMYIYYKNLAYIYEKQKEYSKAVEFRLKAIATLKTDSNTNLSDLIKEYKISIKLLKKLNQYDKVLEYQNKILELQLKELDAKDPDLAKLYNDIAISHFRLKDFNSALTYQQKCLDIEEEVLKPNSSSLGLSYWNFASIYKELGDFDKALFYQEKCVAIFNESLAEDHNYRKKALKSLLDYYNYQARNEFNRKEYLAAIKVYSKINKYGKDAGSLNSIGLCYYYLKDYKKSISYYNQAAELAPENKTNNYYNNTGTAYVKDKQFEEAKNAFTKYEKLFPESGRAYRNWAMYYALQNQKEKALLNLQKAIDLGYKDINWLEQDDSMNEVREESVFKELLKKLKEAVEE